MRSEVALRKESVDRNHVVLVVPAGCWLSLSARRAWIEISSLDDILAGVNVALRKESVDRNSDAVQIVIVIMVALRKESVDRNVILTWFTRSRRAVALRKESVDRNSGLQAYLQVVKVALRKESVDRNPNFTAAR